jgi:hypothetical protein
VRKSELKVSKKSESETQTEAPKRIRYSKKKKLSVSSNEELFVEDKNAGDTEPSIIQEVFHENTEDCIPSTSDYKVSETDDYEV